MDRAYFQNTRPEMAALVPATRQRVLEIGCGEGRFLAALEGVGERWGIEPDPDAAGVAATRLGRVLATGFDEAEANLPSKYFDVIICNDVIEHMNDHDDFFRRVQLYMAPGGVIVGSVPNVRYFRNLFDLLALADWHYKDSGVLDRTHKRFFTAKSMRRSLTEAGFAVQHVGGINSGLTLNFGRGQGRYTVFGFGLIGLSFGLMRDIACMQVAFRAALKT